MAFHSGVGNVIQTAPVFKGDGFSTSSTSFTDVTGLSVTITPKFANSDIQVAIAFGMAGTTQSNLDHGNGIRILRSIDGGSYSDDTNLNGSADGNRNRLCFKGHGWSYNAEHNSGGIGFVGVDVNPSYTLGNSIIYKVQVRCQDSSYPFNLGRTATNGNNNQVYSGRTASSIIAMELGG